MTIADEMMVEQHMRANQSAWQPPDSKFMRIANNAQQGERSAPSSPYEATAAPKRAGRRRRQPGDPPIAASSAYAMYEEDHQDEAEWDVDEPTAQHSPQHSQSAKAAQHPVAPKHRSAAQSASSRSPLPESVRQAPHGSQQRAQRGTSDTPQQQPPGNGNRQLELPSFGGHGSSEGSEAVKMAGNVRAAAMSPELHQDYPPSHREQHHQPLAPQPPVPQQAGVMRRSATMIAQSAAQVAPQAAEESDTSPQSVWMQVQRVNALSDELEAALLELRSLSLATQGSEPSADFHGESIEPDQLRWDTETAVVPYVQPEMDAYVLRTRVVKLAQVQPVERGSVDLLGRRSPVYAPNYAHANPPAHALLPSPQPAFPPAVPFTALDPPHMPTGRSGSDRPQRDWFLQFIQLPTTPLRALNDALSWVVGAGLVRVGLELLRTFSPALWTPALLLLLVALAWGAYRGITVSKSKPILAYRLVLVILGLMLGGKFWTR